MDGKSTLKLMKAIFDVASKIDGCKDTIFVDSGIYRHYFPWATAVNDDIVILAPIIGNDAIQVILDHMLSQFDNSDLDDRSCVLSDVHYSVDEKTIKFVWSS